MYIIQSVFEIIIVAVLIVGLFNEGHIAEWERRQFEKIKAKFRRF